MFTAAELVFGHQHIHTTLISLAVIGTDATDWINGIKLTSCPALPSLFTVFAQLLPLAVVDLQVNGKELLITLIIFNFPVNDGLVVTKLLCSRRSIDIFEHEEDIAANECTESIVSHTWLILFFLWTELLWAKSSENILFPLINRILDNRVCLDELIRNKIDFSFGNAA